MQKQTDQVRQVLMNELGLTRESIREEVRIIVTTTAENHFKKMLADGKLTSALIEAATLVLKQEQKSPSWSSSITFEDRVKKAAREAAEKFISDHLRFEKV